MPWAQMLREYSHRLSKDDWAQLPRGLDCLQYLFRLHLKVAGTDLAKGLQQVRLRPCVLVHLLVWLWRIRPDLFTNATSIMKRMANTADDAVRAVAEARVHAEYPEHEGHLPEHERQGIVPDIFQVVASENEEDIRPPAKSAKPQTMERPRCGDSTGAAPKQFLLLKRMPLLLVLRLLQPTCYGRE